MDLLQYITYTENVVQKHGNGENYRRQLENNIKEATKNYKKMYLKIKTFLKMIACITLIVMVSLES